MHSHYNMYSVTFNTVFLLFITVVFFIATTFLDSSKKNPDTDILPKLTNLKPGSLKKSNVKRIYFVNNSPDTIGARSLTIPRYGIPKKPTKVWFFTISFKLLNWNYIFWCKGENIEEVLGFINYTFPEKSDLRSNPYK